jgi:hypothetical protein
MMGLAKDEKLLAALPCDEGWKWGLIDSGSAVTAAGWAFASHVDTEVNKQRPQLTSVSGAPIMHYGKRTVPCDIMTSAGIQEATLRPEIADVNKLVVSVSSLSDNAVGTWFPPGGRKGYKLVTPAGNVVKLDGPCIINGETTAPIERHNGVYWMMFRVRRPGLSTAALLVAPVENEDMFEDLMEEFDPRDFQNEVAPEAVDAHAPLPVAVAQPTTPVEPTFLEKLDHDISGHATFAAWCGHCPAGRGREGAHRRLADESEVPKLFFDYGFLSEQYQLLREEDIVPGRTVVTYALLVDQRSGSVNATVVQKKGASDEYSNTRFGAWLDRLGYNKVVLTTDNERSVKAFATKIKEKTACDVVLRTRETSVQVVAGGVRSICSHLAERAEKPVPLDSNVMTWVIPFAAFCRTRFSTGTDGSTPYSRVNGSQYSGLMVNFGEQVMLKVYDGDSKFKSRWRKGCWVGKSELNDSAFVATPEGVFSGRTVHRLPDQPYHMEFLLKMPGVPWNAQLGGEVVQRVRHAPPVPGAPPIRRANSEDSSDDDPVVVGERPAAPASVASSSGGSSAAPGSPAPASPGNVPMGSATPDAANMPVQGTPPRTPQRAASSSAAPQSVPISPGAWKRVREG